MTDWRDYWSTKAQAEKELRLDALLDANPGLTLEEIEENEKQSEDYDPCKCSDPECPCSGYKRYPVPKRRR